MSQVDLQEFPRARSQAQFPLIHDLEAQDKSVVLKSAQNYALPRAVQLALNTDLNQANALPLVTALFAGGLLTLAQTIPDEHPDNAAWGALLFFIYSAIILNLSATILFLMVIKMCTDLPHHAQQLVLSKPDSWPSRAAREEILPEEFLTKRWDLLREFGMSPKYQLLDAVLVFILFFGGLYTFIAVILWVWLKEPRIVAGVTMLTVVPAVLSVIYGLAAACAGEGWQ